MLNAVYQTPPPVFQYDPSLALCRNMRLAAPLVAPMKTENMVEGKRGILVGTTFTQNRFGQVATFAGAEKVTYRLLPELVDDKSFTVSFWAQANAGPTDWCFIGSQNGGGAGFTVDYNVFSANKISWTKSGVSSKAFTWTRDALIHHYCFSADQTNVRFYLDGKLSETHLNTNGINTGGAPGLGIGYRNVGTPDYFLTGKMWSVCWWNRRALSGSDVRQIYLDPFFYLQKDATLRPLLTDMPGGGGGGGGAAKASFAPGWMWDED